MGIFFLRGDDDKEMTMDFIKLFNSRGYFITPYVDEFDGLGRTFTWRLSAKQRACLRYKMNGATKGFYPLIETDEDAEWLRDVAEHMTTR